MDFPLDFFSGHFQKKKVICVIGKPKLIKKLGILSVPLGDRGNQIQKVNITVKSTSSQRMGQGEKFQKNFTIKFLFVPENVIERPDFNLESLKVTPDVFVHFSEDRMTTANVTLRISEIAKSFSLFSIEIEKGRETFCFENNRHEMSEIKTKNYPIDKDLREWFQDRIVNRFLN